MTSTDADRLEDHVPWATEQALGVVMAQRATANREEAVAEGLQAMCLAWERYNPALGEFEPFARERVIGAVRRFLKQDRRLRAVEILSDCAEEIDAVLDGPGEAWTRVTRAVREGADAIGLTIHLAEAAAEPERDEELAKELERLGPAELKLFDLRYRRGLAWEEVGTALGIGESAARKRDKSLRDKLRSALSRRRKDRQP